MKLWRTVTMTTSGVGSMTRCEWVPIEEAGEDGLVGELWIRRKTLLEPGSSNS